MSIALFLFTSLLSGISYADQSLQLDPVQTKLAEFHMTGNYLGALNFLEAEVAKGEKEKAQYTQTLGFHYSFVGEYTKAIKAMHAAWSEPPPSHITPDLQRALLSAVKIQKAEAAICEEIKKHQIVIINENHHHPQHRNFGTKLLPCFKAAGFKYFALEAIGEDTAAINSRGRVSRQATGYYTAEPQMAALVNRGLQLGLKIVRYETRQACTGCSVEDSIDQREEDQANNLIAEIFSREPKAKVLIWVGFAHAYKLQLEPSIKSRWMAARLWQKTSIEPFSIEQLSEQFAWNVQRPTYRVLSAEFKDLQPSYVDLRKSWNQIPEDFRISLRKTEAQGPPAIDAIVVHPARAETDTRHFWLGASAQKRLSVRLQTTSKAPRFLVQIFSARLQSKDLLDETPLDQGVCETSQKCELVSRPGLYWLRIWDHDKVLFSKKITLGFKQATQINF